jgi:ankyrin repeat protein
MNSDELTGAFEVHAPDEIRAALAKGADPNAVIDGKPAIWRLIEMYTRSSRFAACLRVMIDAGAKIDDPLLEAVLLEDAGALRELLAAAPDEIRRTLHMECAYTSLHGVSPLHVCAEYNGTACARVLLDAGIDVNVRASIDANGMGGQTAIFHTVNSNRNHCRGTMELLVDAGADLDVRLDGLIWGRGCDWETAVFDVTPISYAQCGLYPQFHRREQDVYANVAYLHRRKHGHDPHIPNVPNKYVTDDFDLPAARRGQRPESDDQGRSA